MVYGMFHISLDPAAGGMGLQRVAACSMEGWPGERKRERILRRLLANVRLEAARSAGEDKARLTEDDLACMDAYTEQVVTHLTGQTANSHE